MKQGWEIKKLGEVFTLKAGKSISSDNIKPDGGEKMYPCFGGNGIRGYVDTYIAEGAYPIIGRVGALCGNIQLSQGKFYATEHAIVAYIKSNDIKAEWAALALKSLNLRQYAKGVAQPVISAGQLAELSIPIPPREEQERIVEELDCLSGVIEKKREQLKQLDALAQSIFYQMFGDPITNEKGWEVKKLGEVANSVNYGTSSPATEDGYYTYIRMNNLTYSGYLDLNDVKKIDVSENEMEKCIVRKGDILFNRTNSKDLVGKTALFDLDEEMIIAGYIIRVRVNTDVVLPIYVVRYMNTPFMKTYFRNLCKGAVNQANINSKELKAIPILMPHIELQQEYAEKIEAIEKQKELIKQSIAETEELFNSRMQYYFN